MTVRVKLFAAARQFGGADELCIELPDGGSVGQLRQALAERAPNLAGLLRHSVFAINAEYVSDDAPVPENADVALIPPVSGG